MKKVKVEIKSTSPGRRFWLFKSSYDLIEWIRNCYLNPTSQGDDVPKGAHEITLRKKSFLEVEWWGCEYVQQTNNNWLCLNLVRIGESVPSQNASGNIITCHMGWIIDTIIPIHDFEDENIEVRRIDDYEGESELNLDILFKERGIETI